MDPRLVEGLEPRWQDWAAVQAVCHALADGIIRLLEPR